MLSPGWGRLSDDFRVLPDSKGLSAEAPLTARRDKEIKVEVAAKKLEPAADLLYNYRLHLCASLCEFSQLRL